MKNKVKKFKTASITVTQRLVYNVSFTRPVTMERAKQEMLADDSKLIYDILDTDTIETLSVEAIQPWED